MKPWDLDTSAAQLRDALDELQLAWRQTGDEWQDPVSQKFCETYLDPLGPALKKTLDAVGQMQQLVNLMTRDCES